MQQYLAPVKHFADVKIQCWPIDPLHEEDRKSRATNKDAFRRVTKPRKGRYRLVEKVLPEHAIALVAVAEVTGKTADRIIAVAVHRLQFVDVSKLAGSHDRHAETIDGRQRLAQSRIRETDRRTLYYFGEVPGRGPVSRNLFGGRGDH